MKEKETQFLTRERKRGESVKISEGNDFSSLVEKVTRELRLETKRRLSCSETMSLYSDIPERYLGQDLGGIRKNLKAREALSLVLLISEINPSYENLIRIEISEICYLKQYQGLWLKVQRLCELKELDHKVYFLLEKGFSPNEIFGNMIKPGVERLKKIKFFNPNRGIITYPIRKRGYKDHGSRRESHLWLPDRVHLGPNPKRLDFRNLLGNARRSLINFLWG